MTGRAAVRTNRVRRRRRWLPDRRIRTKLALILVLPVLASVVLAGLNVASAAGQAWQAGQARDLVALGGSGAQLVAALQHERTSAVLVFAEASSPTAVAEYQRQAAATEAAAAAFRVQRERTRLPSSLIALVDRIDGELAGLVSLRLKVVGAPDAVLSGVVFRYRAVIADLIAYRQALGQVGVAAATANGLRSVAALSQAIESHSQLQVAAMRAMVGGRLSPAGQQDIVAANAGIGEALQTFADLGQLGWQARLNHRIGGGPEIVAAERLQGLVTRAQPGATLALGVDARGWSQAMATRVDRMHALEAELDAELLTAVTAERDMQQRTIVVSAGAVAGLLLVVLVLGAVVTRSLAGTLSRLRAGALEVADQRLPDVVARLNSHGADPDTITRLIREAAAPIAVEGRDEVGQVAAAFNSTAAAAVRIAGEQAALRAGVGAILVALAWRLQARADAMMVSLDGLQRDEQDPDRLQRMFDLDHTAMLIRRMIANLHILAGGRGGRIREGEVPLPDVLKAASQEIEAFVRVEFTEVDEGVLMAGQAVDDLIHLLAELLDNATRFSPPDTAVEVAARRVGDQLHIQIRDQGQGMTEAQLYAVRERLAHPRRIDHRTTSQMGIPVVGAMAQHLGIRINVRSTLRQGTTVDLIVAADLFTHRPAALESTRQMATITAAAPSSWPPAADSAPRVGAQPVIYEQLADSWFQQRPGVGAGSAATGSAATPQAPAWAGAVLATNVVGPLVAAARTFSGLPIRLPGQTPHPQLPPPPSQPLIPVRDPQRLGRQLAGFQRGLGQAGRRHHRPESN